MANRIRFSNELYQVLHAKAHETELSIELLVERYILDAMRHDAERSTTPSLPTWTQTQSTEELISDLVN